ncbi:MAG: aminoacyl-tRNA hydrolase, partial [Gammaproteobacteria bacterium]
MAEPVRLLIGLGNPGSEYEHTRHNAGSWFIQRLAARCNVSFKHETKLQAYVGMANLADQRVILAVPTTFMNHSGFATQKLMHFYKVETQALLVAHDELDLPPGIIRLKAGGGHGGNNGLRHIIEQLGQQKQFVRLRLGIGHPGNKS